MRELFVDELVTVRGGASSSMDSTRECCEEVQYACCENNDWIYQTIEDLLCP